jgi:hypothetical protein
MKIITIIGIKNCTLVVYYSSRESYQFAIIDEEGIILEPGDIFSAPEHAEKEGREIINAVSGYFG